MLVDSTAYSLNIPGNDEVSNAASCCEASLVEDNDEVSNAASCCEASLLEANDEVSNAASCCEASLVEDNDEVSNDTSCCEASLVEDASSWPCGQLSCDEITDTEAPEDTHLHMALFEPERSECSDPAFPAVPLCSFVAAFKRTLFDSSLDTVAC